ncbi:hypothetical protein [Microbacterium sp. No. 7]|uniref:hypothetical protein n=1 Tax=Microbacterium sp. No. 7 TaxID=1714373 RepID=UPI0006D19D2B|nr:hypothetical protein [Microbacterium sp. No. 7]ALJ19616.1 DNA-directed RNA polymerase subunit beta [Microbacterium sp. No. 7]
MSEAPREFHKPVRRAGDHLDRRFSSADPAERSRVATMTATALLTRVRAQPTDAVVQRLIGYATTHGIDTIAELWAHSPARSLPGVLWRIYLLQLMIHEDARTSSLLYERGRAALESADEAIAGASAPAGPDELVVLAEQILHGVFVGDFAIALERAASFCRVESAGAIDLADDYDATEPERGTALTRRALRLSRYADDLTVCAGLWRRGELG